MREKVTTLKRKKIVMEDQYIALARQRREETLRDDRVTKHYESETSKQEQFNEKELSEFERSIELLNEEKERTIKYVTDLYERKKEALELKQDIELKGIVDKFEAKQNALEKKENVRKEKREKTISFFKGKIEETLVAKPLDIKYPPLYYKLASELEDLERQISSKEELIKLVKQGEQEEGAELKSNTFHKKSHFDEDDSWMRSPEYIAEEKIRQQQYASKMSEHKRRIEEAEEANRQTELAAALAKRAIREAEEQRVKQKYENIALGIPTANATATQPKKQKDEDEEEDDEDGNSACGDEEEEYQPYECPSKEELMADYESFLKRGNVERANFKKLQLREIYKVFL
jgi:hypothetical protein